jgi:hypothetical protein
VPRSCLQAFPRHQRPLSLGRVLPHPADGKAIEANLLRDRDVRLRRQQVEDAAELLAAVAWLPPQVDAISVGLRVGDTGPLGELCAFYLKIINVGEKGFYRIGVASIPGRLKLSRKYFARGLHSCLI